MQYLSGAEMVQMMISEVKMLSERVSWTKVQNEGAAHSYTPCEVFTNNDGPLARVMIQGIVDAPPEFGYSCARDLAWDADFVSGTTIDQYDADNSIKHLVVSSPYYIGTQFHLVLFEGWTALNNRTFMKYFRSVQHPSVKLNTGQNVLELLSSGIIIDAYPPAKQGSNDRLRLRSIYQFDENTVLSAGGSIGAALMTGRISIF
eukprot:TRINITY_DN5892_c0_g1_i1.p1 TRINITY_DN5892_c0_g1~~TRINITY_DN5892_c0_g1_i1.p1  ORF type:complete len:203 (+),score=26.75 TRINITY_DN5892_c0_g1_i1:164-772(+)